MSESIAPATFSASTRGAGASRRRLWSAGSIGLGLSVALILFSALGTPPVSRIQEARVLETAREMVENGGRQWLIPQLNGRPRMRKPPLAYWTTAVAYRLMGVSEGVGRDAAG